VSLAARVASLESGAAGPCGGCGHDPDAVVTYSIIWETEPDAPAQSSPACGICGNVAVLVLDWEDEGGGG
jgi:hypothetical protein